MSIAIAVASHSALAMDERARQLKRSICFCSECGKQLRYRSFSAHPCYYLAVKRYGTYKARL